MVFGGGGYFMRKYRQKGRRENKRTVAFSFYSYIFGCTKTVKKSHNLLKVILSRRLILIEFDSYN